MSPNTTLIFGGHGKVAQHLTRLLVQQEGHTVYSVIRNPAQSSQITSLGATPIVQSIESSSIDSLTQTIRDSGANTIIWAAGAGAGSPERTQTVDNEGAIKSMKATKAAGVERYIIVSALDVRDRETKPEPEWYNDSDRTRSEKVWSAIGTYMRAKLAADRFLVTESGIGGYTVVRPGGLSDEPGTGKVEAGKVHLDRMVGREDVARVVVECVRNEGTRGLAFDVVGGEMGIREAVEGVVGGRVDTFEGRY